MVGPFQCTRNFARTFCLTDNCTGELARILRCILTSDSSPGTRNFARTSNLNFRTYLFMYCNNCGFGGVDAKSRLAARGEEGTKWTWDFLVWSTKTGKKSSCATQSPPPRSHPPPYGESPPPPPYPSMLPRARSPMQQRKIGKNRRRNFSEARKLAARPRF
jgi:hypothetical protein